MLIGPKRPRFGVGRPYGEVAPDEPLPAQAVAPRNLPQTPIYEGGSPLQVPRGQAPKQMRWRLYDRMADWRFHGLGEFDAWMPERQWIRAMCDLVEHGFTFDRDGLTLRLRKRRMGEPTPSIVELLSGITVPDEAAPSKSAEKPAPVVTKRDDLSKPTVTPSEKVIPEGDRIFLDVDSQLDLSVPELVSESTAILARKGAGKTYLGGVIAEAFLECGFDVPFAVFDPMGAWKGLLANADGTPSEYRIALCGGESGEFAISPEQGALFAEIVLDRYPLPFIFDLSNLDPAGQHLFYADFVAAFFAACREPFHIFVDEADLFAPQRLDGSSEHQKRCLAQTMNLAMRGRRKGIGSTFISLRPAVLNKNVLSQVLRLFVLQMIAPQDLDAIENWLAGQVMGERRRTCREELPILPRGVAYMMQGGEGSRFGRFRVRAKSSFDSSYTPRLGEKKIEPELARLDDEEAAAISTLLGMPSDEGMAALPANTQVSPEDPKLIEAVPAETPSEKPDLPKNEVEDEDDDEPVTGSDGHIALAGEPQDLFEDED